MQDERFCKQGARLIVNCSFPYTDTCTNHILSVMCLEQNPLTHIENCYTYLHPACTAAPMLETLEHNTVMPTAQNAFPERSYFRGET
jgi:hypothetical protein